MWCEFTVITKKYINVNKTKIYKCKKDKTTPLLVPMSYTIHRTYIPSGSKPFICYRTLLPVHMYILNN